MEPLRILHFDSYLDGGGTDDQVGKLVGGLHRSGQTVWLAGPDGKPYSKMVQELGVQFHGTRPETPARIRVLLDLARFIRRGKIQVVHGHHGRDLWPAILAAHLSGIRPKIILNRHLAKSPSSWASRRFLLSQCDALVAVSQFVAKVLKEGAYEPDSPESERRARRPIYGDHSKIRVIYGGIDTDQFQPSESSPLRAEWKLEPEHFVFAAVGGYYFPRGKGQREFLQAAAQIHLQAPGARFLIIGRGNMTELLRNDIARLGLSAKAWLTPWCQDMPAPMNALDCLVHAQVGTEAFPGVVLEAHACGKPVIASALDGIPEAFGPGNLGLLVEPESVPALAQAMHDWAQRPRLSSAEKQQLHERVKQRFSVSVMVEKM